MMTWQLWNQLRGAPRHHPIFRYAAGNLSTSRPPGCIQIFAMLFFLLPLTVIASTIVGALIAANVAAAISRERENNTFELLGVTPEGPFGISWLLGTGVIYGQTSFEQLQSLYTWFFRAAVVLLGFLIFDFTLGNNNAFSVGMFSLTLLEGALVIFALVLDHINAIVLGILVGMLLPVVARDRGGAQAGALILYLLLRMSIWLVTGIIAFNVFPALFGTNPFVIMLLRVIQLAVFALVSEAVVAVMWQTIAHYLQSPTTLEKRTS